MDIVMKPTSFKPKARQDDLVVQELEREVIAYDLKRDEAFGLNESAAQVWSMCDGHTTVQEMAHQLGPGATGGASKEDVVWLALDYLNEAGLLENVPEAAPIPPAYSRRAVMSKLIRVAVVAPLVSCILVPTPAAASSACATCLNLSGGQTCTVECATVVGDCYRRNNMCSGAVSQSGITCTQCKTALIPNGQQGCTMTGGCACSPGGGFNNCSWIG